MTLFPGAPRRRSTIGPVLRPCPNRGLHGPHYWRAPTSPDPDWCAGWTGPLLPLGPLRPGTLRWGDGQPVVDGVPSRPDPFPMVYVSGSRFVDQGLVTIAIPKESR